MNNEKKKWKVDVDTDDSEGKSYHIFHKKEKTGEKKE